MPTKLQLKKSSVAGKVPTVSDLDYGELALNYNDGRLYFKRADGSTIDYFSAGTSSSSSSNLTVSSSAPPFPSNGDEWLNTNTGIKYTYVNDGTSSQWVELESALSISQSNGTSFTSIYNTECVLSGTSVGDTETEIFIDGVPNNRISVPLDKTIYYTADIVCRRTDSSGDHAAFYLKGVATNSSGLVTDVGLIYEVVVARTDAVFSVDFRADDVNNTVNFYVKGNTGKTMSWKCALTILEV